MGSPTSYTKTSMCDAPISASDIAALAFLERAGWTNAELIWEQIQEAAGQASVQGDHTEALELWRGAVDVAEEYLVDNDPRRATSLCNLGVAQTRAGEDAQELFAEALRLWDRCGPWIGSLRPERRARSSTFHLRLERKHPKGYDYFSERRLQRLVEEGRAAVEDRFAGSVDPSLRLERWCKERPPGFTDLRKLLGAVLLTV